MPGTFFLKSETCLRNKGNPCWIWSQAHLWNDESKWAHTTLRKHFKPASENVQREYPLGHALFKIVVSELTFLQTSSITFSRGSWMEWGGVMVLSSGSKQRRNSKKWWKESCSNTWVHICVSPPFCTSTGKKIQEAFTVYSHDFRHHSTTEE